MSTSIRTFRRKLKYSLLYGVVMGMIRFSEILPRKWWLGLCGALGKLIFLVSPGLRKQVISNLELAYPQEKTPEEIRKLGSQVLVMMSRSAASLLRGFHSDPEQFRARCIVHGEENARIAHGKGKGIIFLTAHLGPFESVATDIALRGYEPHIIGSPLKDPRLNEIVEHHRTKFGGALIERGKETFRVMKNLTTGGAMVILIDQNTKVKSIPANFFGKPCPTPVGATMLALKSGAAVVPVFAHLREDGFEEIQYYPELTLIKTSNDQEDISVNTQLFNDVIEREVRKYPAQWVWMHKRWD